MTKRGITSVFIMVALLAATPVFALDPEVIGTMSASQSCLLADFTADMGTINSVDVETGTDFLISVETFDMMQGSTAVGRLISHYQRIASDTTSEVVMEDTAVMFAPGLTMTVFGRSYNTSPTHRGARGVIMGAVDSSGNVIDLKGFYIITEDTPGKICAFLIP